MHTQLMGVTVAASRQLPRIRPAALEDYSQIAALGSRYGLDWKKFDSWKDLWLANPVYRQLPDWPLGWVLENEDRRISGFIGNIPQSYSLGDRTLLAAASHALVVDLPYRSHSLSLISRFYAQKNVDLFLSTTSNAQASKAYAIFGARRVPLGTWDSSAYWVLDHRRFAATALAMKNVRLANPLSYIIGPALYLKDLFLGTLGHAHRGASGPEIAECSSFDQRFETFWEDLRTCRSSVLLAARSRETLQWHFKAALADNQGWILTVNKGDRLRAYSVFFRQDSVRFGLERVRLADFQCLDEDHGDELLKQMISYAATLCRREHVSMLETIGLPLEKQRVIDSLRPHRRELPCWLYFYKTNDKYLAQELARPEVWDASYFDGDSSL
jgi:hypothetical protein